jgi:two-component system sensor kinase FixL
LNDDLIVPATTEAKSMKNTIEFLKFLKESQEPEIKSGSLMQLIDGLMNENEANEIKEVNFISDKKKLVSLVPSFTNEVNKGIEIALGLESGFSRLQVSGPSKEVLIQKLLNKTKELNEFSYIISHDLKAPLRAISSLTLWLKSDYSDKFDAEGQQFLELLLDRVSKMDKLIDCILQFSRVSNSNEVKANIDLNILLPFVMGSLKVPEGIKISIDHPLPVLNSGEKSMTLVFQHLLGNAIKYMGKTDGEINIGATLNGLLWTIYVKDNGPGIDPKYHEKIFEIFQSLQTNDSEEIGGMGLTIVKKVIEANDGKVWVESTPGAGATFFFTWPK